MMKPLTLGFALILAGCGQGSKSNLSLQKSITDPEWLGNKYIFTWGAARPSDPGFMHNEVKYDVLHTHKVMTSVHGGDYVGGGYVGPRVANRNSIIDGWKKIQTKTTSKDMYFQYSSGHGQTSGLEVGVRYSEMRDFALSLPAQEVIIVTMACYSGNLVDSFNRQRELWNDYQSQGRNLLVLASSQSHETSQHGPGTDAQEPSGAPGSAGSAFGYAFWKAIVGYADGSVNQVKDGEITLREMLVFVNRVTRQIGGHTPKHTGSFDPELVLTLKPTRQQLELAIGHTPEGMHEINQIANDIGLE